MRFFSKKRSGVNDRGAAIYQDKNWQGLQLPRKTIFIHCGKAPFAQQTDGLKRALGKEICTVKGTAETKFILCFPMLDVIPQMLPDPLTLAKPCQMLWDYREMPRAFVFQLPAGTQVWTESAQLAGNREVGLAFDVVFEDYLLAQYNRRNKAEADLIPLDGVHWT